MKDLIEFHDKRPGITESTWGALKTKEGRSSYQVLSGDISADVKIVLDLACGSGPLVRTILADFPQVESLLGIDFSDSELMLARSETSSPKVKWLKSSAQELPIQESSVDCVLCHMALMLMRPIEPVLREVSRVLKSGGVFSAVISGLSTQEHSLFRELMGVAREAYVQNIPDFKNPAFQDERMKDPDSIRTLFRSVSAFDDGLKFEDFELVWPGSAQDIASRLGDFFYTFESLGPEDRRDLEEKWKTILGQSKAKSLSLPLTKITVRRQ